MSLANQNTQPINWDEFGIQAEDLEFLSSYLLEIETPLGPEELATQLIVHRLKNRQDEVRTQRAEAGKVYLPKERYAQGERVAFPNLDWKSGRVSSIRPAAVLNGHSFEVISIEFEDGSIKEYASGLSEHSLNAPLQKNNDGEQEQIAAPAAKDDVKKLAPKIIAALRESPDFVYIAGRWFPKTLIVDVTSGQLNVAEAALDVVEGGPLPTNQLLGEVELPPGVNPKLAEFSLDLALQSDPRFDEVGPSGEVAWFLNRLEPEAVRETPLYLRYESIEQDRSAITEDMLDLERRLDDELSPMEAQEDIEAKEVQIPLIFPHWRVGSLPLTRKVSSLFPSALESPRVRFQFVDAQNGERFQGWVVRRQRYVVGLRDWYMRHGLMPGSNVRARRGEKPGEVIVSAEAHRASKEWVRTGLVGADGGVVYATLKQTVETSFDERMMIFLPGELLALDNAWQRRANQSPRLESMLGNALRDLAKLSSQNHVHATELYSAINLQMRVPPGPVLALLASRPQFQHVGHLHFRLVE
ncbi:MAG: hypothetical protein WEC37_02605 [Anaerolineales bacterium]